MIRKTKKRDHIINLDSPEGNAFLLIAKAKELCKKKGLKFEVIYEEMSQGDYINLLKVFDKYFGDEVIFETENKHYLISFGLN